MSDAKPSDSIKAIDKTSVHRITSGQVVIDLQTAVKELIENSLDAGATSIEVRFKEYGLKSIEVIDNGSGISKENYESLALKHHTSKLATYEDLTTVRSFGFRGEALSSLCALSESVVFTTATAEAAPMGTILEYERSGKLKHCNGRIARQRGTTATVTNLFAPLPVRRKELERNIKREYGKVLALLDAYALVPCAQENRGVKLTVTNTPDSGRRTTNVVAPGVPSVKASISQLWGPKQLHSLVPLKLDFSVQPEKVSLKRLGLGEQSIEIDVTGFISKFASGCGRVGTDRQYFYVNGRPCNLPKIQKAFNEVYRTFNASQSAFIIADFRIPTASCDVNVSPDKRTIMIHAEANLIFALKECLENTFSEARLTFPVQNPLSKESKPSSSAQAPSAGPCEEVTRLSPERHDAGEDSTSTLPSDVRHERIESEAQDEPMEEAGIVTRDDIATGGGDDEILPKVTAPLFHPPSPPTEARTLPSDDSPAQSTEKGTIPPTPPTTTPVKQIAPEASGSSSPAFSSPLNQVLSKRTASALTIDSTAEFLHVVSPVGTKKTYTSPTKEAFSQTSQGGGGSKRPVQAILSTSGASWNLRRENEMGPRKKSKVDVSFMKSKTIARNDRKVDFKTRLTNFARLGSQRPLEPLSDNDATDATSTDAGDYVTDQDTDDIREDAQTDEEMGGDRISDETRSERHQSPVDSRVISRGSSVVSVTSLPPNGPQSSNRNDVISLVDDDVELSPSDPTLQDSDIRLPQSRTTKSADVVKTVNNRGDRLFLLDLERLRGVWQRCSPGRAAGPFQGERHARVGNAASISNARDQKGAEEELARVICKSDFETMVPVGQFNLGFIVARRQSVTRSTGTSSSQTIADDLFLIDQHAADEKYNFETLQATTKIQSQRLFKPRLLELSAADELIALENIEVLRSNGFEITVKPGEDGERDRILLVAQSVSRGTSFDVRDFEELLDLMKNLPTGQMVRCSKARNMFASRACRKSVMIGMPLTTGQMTTATCKASPTTKS
ncbi:hypothetical protein FRB99_006151 [Tulasnella sp. 403]|nr:hypothetical protein FRB99_006151 [Tulasnella sp. 403]